LLLAAFGVGLLFVAGAAAVLAALLAADAEAWVTHTMDVRQVAGELLADVEAAQAGYRSYLLTEDKRFLHPYETALPKHPFAGMLLLPDSSDRVRSLPSPCRWQTSDGRFPNHVRYNCPNVPRVVQ
jgi:CHASE3 domain